MENSIKFNPKKELILPEYGRNLQNMVEYAITIEDREERTRCANTIIKIMGTMFPYLRDIEGFKYKLWDHLAIMSDFKLDIDYPFDIVQKENINSKPAKIPYSTRKAKYMHYGKTIEMFIEKAVEEENEEKRQCLTNIICNYMKKSLMVRNKEIATDKKVITDVKTLSKGHLEVSEDIQFSNFEEYKKHKYHQNKEQNNKNKKKSKR